MAEKLSAKSSGFDPGWKTEGNLVAPHELTRMETSGDRVDVRQKDLCTLLLDPRNYFARPQRRHPPFPRVPTPPEPPEKVKLHIDMVPKKRHFAHKTFWDHGIFPSFLTTVKHFPNDHNSCTTPGPHQ